MIYVQVFSLEGLPYLKVLLSGTVSNYQNYLNTSKFNRLFFANRFKQSKVIEVCDSFLKTYFFCNLFRLSKQIQTVNFSLPEKIV